MLRSHATIVGEHDGPPNWISLGVNWLVHVPTFQLANIVVCCGLITRLDLSQADYPISAMYLDGPLSCLVYFVITCNLLFIWKIYQCRNNHISLYLSTAWRWRKRKTKWSRFSNKRPLTTYLTLWGALCEYQGLYDRQECVCLCVPSPIIYVSHWNNVENIAESYVVIRWQKYIVYIFYK